MSLSLGPDLPEVFRAAVFGLAKSGQATVRALLARGVSVVATDSAPAEKLGPLPLPDDRRLTLVLGSHPPSLLADVDLCVVSPGVPMTIPALDVARASGIPVIAEVELASRLVPGLVVGITGTNGKSTTTALCAALLRDAGRDAVACGNFGTPWIHWAETDPASPGEPPAPTRVWVVELSSFQIEGFRRLAPDVAVHLNLTPDHLDRYRSVDDYGAAKARIFESQGEAQVAVLNADDPLVSRIRTRARRLPFSRARALEQGAWLKDGVFLADVGKGPRAYARREDLQLPGSHNVENALAALAATIPLGVTPETAVRTFRTFKGLPHRTVLVRTRNGVAFYNDSKGTNIDATLKSLDGFPDGSVFLILGGKDKGDDFRRLLPLVARKARKVLAIGKAAPAVMRALADGAPCEETGTIARSIEVAAAEGRPGDVVLLSPACASFDQFRNFEHRGEVFEELVRALPEAGG